MAKRAYFLVNGIDTWPGDSKNWNGRGVTWIHTLTDSKAEKIEYFCGPIDRAFGQKDRANKLARTVSFYQGWQNILVGHSNGADVILSALWYYPALVPHIEHIHLVCGATGADFERNGLNRWLGCGRVDRVTVYCGGKDRALKLAHLWIGKLLGYGTLGLHGPINIRQSVASRVRTIFWRDYDHSTCWNDAHFTATMLQLTTP